MGEQEIKQGSDMPVPVQSQQGLWERSAEGGGGHYPPTPLPDGWCEWKKGRDSLVKNN